MSRGLGDVYKRQSSIMMSLNTSIDVILFFKQRKLVEVYFDPIRKLQKSLME